MWGGTLEYGFTNQNYTASTTVKIPITNGLVVSIYNNNFCHGAYSFEDGVRTVLTESGGGAVSSYDGTELTFKENYDSQIYIYKVE